VQPDMVTGRLSLPPASASNLSDMLHIWHDPRVRQFLFDDEVPTAEAVEHFFKRNLIAAEHGL
jgi:RimJ/RimL family protein N-acetyltransferase